MSEAITCLTLVHLIALLCFASVCFGSLATAPATPRNTLRTLVHFPCKDVWHSTDGVDWALATDDAPYKNRAASAVVVFEGQLWLMGGHVAKANTPPEKGYPQYTTYNDVWCSTDGTNWTRVLEHAPWVERMWFIATIYHGKMWLIGGYDNVNHQNLGDVWYSEDGVNWYEFTSETRFSPRHEPTCYVYDNSLWVVAGNSWPVMSDVWRLTLPSSH